MSDITNTKKSHSVYGGIIVDIAEDSLTRVQKILSGVRGGWQKAVGSALRRAADTGKTEAKRSVVQEYAISGGTFLSYTKNMNHFAGTGDGIEVVFGYRGTVIPLMKFKTSVKRGGLVTTLVRKDTGTAVLEHAFPASIGSHSGIFERVGPDRFPVKELFGPSTPQMMYSNEAVLDAVERKVTETYEQRIEHEILRLMNGWGG